MVKVIQIVGARPQFIKLAMLSVHMRKFFKEVILHTGQHYDYEMSENFFKELQIPAPDYNLGIHAVLRKDQLARMSVGIEKVLLKEKPRLVIVYGDTNSSLAGALCAKKLNIALAHVEAGLRSFNRLMPEEINRLGVDRISDYLFCPTKTAVSNLKRENIRKNVYLTGDVMYDSVLKSLTIARKKSRILKKIDLPAENYYILTIHRAENTSNIEQLKKLLSSMDSLDLPVIFPIHPRTKKFLAGSFKPKKSLLLIEPVSYLDMLILEENSKAVFTDSGGVQKEAYILKRPCFSLRNETEWVETLRQGANRLISIEDLNQNLLLKSLNFKKRKFIPNIFGNGKAAEKIVKILTDEIN